MIRGVLIVNEPVGRSTIYGHFSVRRVSNTQISIDANGTEYNHMSNIYGQRNSVATSVSEKETAIVPLSTSVRRSINIPLSNFQSGSVYKKIAIVVGQPNTSVMRVIFNISDLIDLGGIGNYKWQRFPDDTSASMHPLLHSISGDNVVFSLHSAFAIGITIYGAIGIR